MPLAECLFGANQESPFSPSAWAWLSAGTPVQQHQKKEMQVIQLWHRRQCFRWRTWRPLVRFPTSWPPLRSDETLEEDSHLKVLKFKVSSSLNSFSRREKPCEHKRRLVSHIESSRPEFFVVLLSSCLISAQLPLLVQNSFKLLWTACTTIP